MLKSLLLMPLLDAYRTGHLIGHYLTIILIILFFIAVIYCVRYIGPDQKKEE